MPSGPILLINGTNRHPSNSFKISTILLRHYQEAQIPAELLALKDLPPEVFHSNSYATKPEAMVALQQRVLAAKGLHVVTPEYNGSFPGVLKYFIDMLKFPESFEHKPVAFVGIASGEWGGLRAVEQLQQVFGYRNAHMFPRRIFINAVAKKLDAEGRLTDPEIDARLKAQALAFAKFCDAVA
jgi:chromate reductase, NAD(P)H dehydrogenase (quinone)